MPYIDPPQPVIFLKPVSSWIKRLSENEVLAILLVVVLVLGFFRGFEDEDDDENEEDAVIA
jgi:hypothetical protein